MTIAAKHFDPLLGIDIHIVLIPSPAGPIPTPLPHPYVGMVFDPFDYVPLLGATVFINGVPRGVAGTNGLAVPPHIPMGGPFAKPPTNESEIFMGSAVVVVEGEPQSFLGLPVLSCQDIGMPAPPRAKKKSVAKSLLLPTTVVLSIPMGMLVLIGGPPTISMMALGMKALLGGLKRLRKMGVIGRKIKALSDKLHNLLAKLAKKLGLGDALRNLVHRALCKVTGHPVDVASGKVFTDAIDFELPGPIPLKWERVWYSTSTYQGPLGHGWHHSYDLGLHVTPELLLLRTQDGRHVGLPPLEPGARYYDRAEKLTLFRDDLGYAIRDRGGLVYRFSNLGSERRLEQISNSLGHTIRFHHGAHGRLERVIDSSGRSLDLAYDRHARLVALVAPHPTVPDQRVTVTRYAYDGYGNLAEVSDALGHSQRFAYHGRLLVQETNRNGLSFYFVWDGNDERARCVRTFGDGGLYDHKLSYDDGGITVVEDSLGHKTTYLHDGAMVREVIDALGNRRKTTYDDDYQVVEETDELGQSTRFAYDERGNLVETTTPDGAVTRIEYGPDDLARRSLDALGGVWTTSYDEHGRVVERTDPLGRSTRIDYDGVFPRKAVDPGGGETWFEHDSSGNVTAIRSADGNQTRYAYDLWGNAVRLVDAVGNVQSREHDLRGRILRVVEPDGAVTTVAYDPEGNAVQIVDAGHEVRFTFQGLGAVASRIESGTLVRFEYDTEEQLKAVVNANGDRYRFEYGPTGHLLRESDFDGAERRYIRDRAGRLKRLERPGGRFSEYEYDPVGNVVVVAYSDGGRESYAYRADGEMVLAENESTRVEFERDPIGRIVRERCGPHWVASEYSARGERCGVTSSFGTDLRIERHAVGEVTGLAEKSSGYRTAYRRDALGLELERLLPGGARSDFRRDPLSRATEHTVKGKSSVLRAVGYTFDRDRLVRLVDAERGPTEFAYDPRGHLSWARYSDHTVQYRVSDAVGNLFASPDRDDRSYGRAGELLTRSGPSGVTRYAYDAEGSLLEKTEPDGKTWRYVWNDAGMLIQVVRPGGGKVRFEYDALGRRVTKTYRGRSTHWVWDGDNPLHEWVEGELDRDLESLDAEPGVDAALKKREAELLERLSQGPPERRGTKTVPVTWLFDPESFAPVARLSGSEVSSIVCDDSGAPVLMLDAGGKKLFAASYGINGELRELQGDRDACPFRFPGQYEDAETGLYYNRFRYYDPESGRYTSRDPIRLAGGLNAYAYVPDPFAWQDPLGLAGVCGPKIIILGEGMWRVKKATRALKKQGKDARWYQAWGKNFPPSMTPDQMKKAIARNERWLKQKIKQGYQIFDIGPEPGRPLAKASPFYAAEQGILKSTGYPSTPLPVGY